MLEKFLNENPQVKRQLENVLSQDGKESSDLFDLLRSFEGFTTYFRNFHENRQNLYSDEDKFSTIAHRLIHENLPKFIDNIRIFDKAKTAGLDIDAIQNQLQQERLLEDIFSIEYFSETLTQRGIDDYNYILGGRSVDPGKPNIRGVNSFINNDINQKAENKKDRIPVMKPLYKLPLFERTSSSFRYEPISDDKDLINRIKSFYYNDLLQYLDETEADAEPVNILDRLKDMLTNISDYRTGLYVNGGLTLTQISAKIFGNWNYIGNALSEYYDKHVDPPKTDKKGNRKPVTKKQEEDKRKWLKQKLFPVTLIEAALTEYKAKETSEEQKSKITDTTICDFIKKCGAEECGKNDLFDRIAQKLTEKNEKGKTVEELLNTDYASSKKLMQDKPKTLLIKNFLDAIQGNSDDITAGLLHFIKTLKPRDEVSDKNETFYSEFEKYYKALSEVTPLYNKARNYLTQRPYSTEKVKLNFENSTLLDGWDENKEADNSCVMFRKDGFYYLGIMDKKHRKVFNEYPKASNGESSYEKMIYKLLPGANKMLPKVFFAELNKKHFNPPDEILRIRNTASHSKNGNPQEGFTKAPFSKADCHKYIDFCKASIAKHWDWNSFGFAFSSTNQYEDSSDFYKEIEQQGYKISFTNVPEKYITQLIDEGKLYLFKIHNKDFSEKKKGNGKDNLHTLYWKMLFDERNLKDLVFKLNGEAEVFFRQKSLRYNEEIWQSGHHPELKDRKGFPFISNKRFAQDKLQFHVPITLNFKSEGTENINRDVNAMLQNNPDVHIIGIDRGERNLLYVSVINQQGEIKEQFSLNEVQTEHNGRIFRKDFQSLLEKRGDDRDKARKDWQTIESIREIKEGYLSHVVHNIAQLILKYNAIIVMEDLNFGFKRGRQKVEKQVYQNFEKMLINKLSYLVFKDRNPDEPGGVLRAYQLANKFESFKKLGKQSGIIFYVPAAYTSAIDPVTGYVQYLYPLKQGDSIEKAKAFYKNFKSIHFNPEKKSFGFVFDYNDFNNIRFEGKPDWKVCTSNTERYAWNKSFNNGKGDQEEVKVTEQLELLLGEYQIPYGSGDDIRDAIVNVKDINKEKTAKMFFSKLNHLLNTTLKLRHNNGKKGTEEQDYILSPVEPFFDSRQEAAKPAEQQKLPVDADANGAFNIARKGLYLLTEKLNKMSLEDFEKTKLSNEEWLTCAQGQCRCQERPEGQP